MCQFSLRVEFVDKVLPEAKYIFIHRNGVDATASAILRWKSKLDVKYTLAKLKYIPVLDIPYYVSRNVWIRLKQVFSKDKRLSFWGPQLNNMKGLMERSSLEELCAKQWSACVENSLRAF